MSVLWTLAAAAAAAAVWNCPGPLDQSISWANIIWYKLNAETICYKECQYYFFLVCFSTRKHLILLLCFKDNLFWRILIKKYFINTKGIQHQSGCTHKTVCPFTRMVSNLTPKSIHCIINSREHKEYLSVISASFQTSPPSLGSALQPRNLLVIKAMFGGWRLPTHHTQRWHLSLSCVIDAGPTGPGALKLGLQLGAPSGSV